MVLPIYSISFLKNSVFEILSNICTSKMVNYEIFIESASNCTDLELPTYFGQTLFIGERKIIKGSCSKISIKRNGKSKTLQIPRCTGIGLMT